MPESPTSPMGSNSASPVPIVIQPVVSQPFWLRRWFVRLLMVLLILSLLYSFGLHIEHERYFGGGTSVTERFRSGEAAADEKIAVITVNGTIMPPFTERILKAIKRAKEDDGVRGVVLVIDSPGGFVADSHQIYDKLKKLSTTKRLFVSMKRMAASGGVYIAMGAGEKGKIFAEPTTWTGSIGVIIPRYDASKLAEKVGVATDALKTGEFKDSLDPFRSLTERDRELWGGILDESFQRFLKIVDDNRATLTLDQVKELATGRLFTAEDAKAKGLIDEIGDEDDAIEALRKSLGLEQVRVVDYEFPATLFDLLWSSAAARDPAVQVRKLLDLSAPHAMYFCGSPSLAWPIMFSTFDAR